MRDELQSLVSKYEEMAKKMEGSSSSVKFLLNVTDMPYSEKVMTISLLPKFKIAQTKMYAESKDPVDQLENFKAHITLQGFSGEIVC